MPGPKCSTPVAVTTFLGSLGFAFAGFLCDYVKTRDAREAREAQEKAERRRRQEEKKNGG